VEHKEERKMFNLIIQQLAAGTFELTPEQKLPQKLGRPYFSHLGCPQDSDDLQNTAEVGKIRDFKEPMEQVIRSFNHAYPQS
jgi:hypothetical protein